MADDRLEAAVPDGEALRFRAALRRDGQVGLTDQRLLVDSNAVVSIKLVNIESVEFERFDWFLGMLSVALVGFGLLSLSRSIIGGVGFAAFGAASLYWTYRKRGKVIVKTHNRPKPFIFYLDNMNSFEDAMNRKLRAAEDRLDSEN